MNDFDLKGFRKRIRVLERKIGEQLDDDLTCCGVSTAQCHALLSIADRRETNISELAVELNLDRSTLSRTIDGLVNIGLVLRKENLSNRRYNQLSLTEQGEKTTARINRQCDDFYSRLFNYIPEKKQMQVMETMSLLVEAFLKVEKSSQAVHSEIEK